MYEKACIGLKCVTGLKVATATPKEEMVFGAYMADPNVVHKEYTDWFVQPEGFLARGSYKGKIYFSDVTKTVQMQLDVQIKVAKDW